MTSKGNTRDGREKRERWGGNIDFARATRLRINDATRFRERKRKVSDVLVSLKSLDVSLEISRFVSVRLVIFNVLNVMLITYALISISVQLKSKARVTLRIGAEDCELKIRIQPIRLK